MLGVGVEMSFSVCICVSTQTVDNMIRCLLIQSNNVIDRDLNLPFKYKHLNLELYCC